MKKKGVTGASIAVIENGEISQVKVFGYADKENGIKNSIEKRFRIASLSKPLTAWGIMNLVEMDKIDLKHPVEDYLIRWKFPVSEYDTKEVTVERLLTHTARVSVSSYGGYSPDKKRTTIVESLNGENVALGPVKLIALPGSGSRYSGGGYSILQLMIEDVTGISYDQYMVKNIIDPMNMKNYSFTYESKDADKMALPHGRNGKRLPVYLYTEKAAGGFICSIEDLANFALSFINTQDILSKEMVELMTDRNGVPTIGILDEEGNKFVGFGGTTLGYCADLWMDMTSKNGYVCMSNSTNGIFLSADIANQWLIENAGVPDPTLMIFNLELYGIRAIAFYLTRLYTTGMMITSKSATAHTVGTLAVIKKDAPACDF